jgi:hypothetical protein
MLICIDEVIIQKYYPLSVSKFAMTVGHEVRLQLLVARVRGGKVFERIGQLHTQ